MNKQTIFAAVLMSVGCLSLRGCAHAQAPVNTVQVGVEGNTVTACSASLCIFKFGVGTAFNSIANPQYPVTFSCVGGCPPALGADPASGTPKFIYAVEQAVAYTVTLDDGTVVPVPANPCALPSVYVANPQVPAAPTSCQLAPGAVAIATDGQMVAAKDVAAPHWIQYCQGAICNPPLLYGNQPIITGPNAALGGPTAGTGLGTLYLIPGPRDVTMWISPAPVAVVIFPAP